MAPRASIRATTAQQPAQPHQATASGSNFDETAPAQAMTAASPATVDHQDEADDGDYATEDEEDDPPRYALWIFYPDQR